MTPTFMHQDYEPGGCPGVLRREMRIVRNRWTRKPSWKCCVCGLRLLENFVESKPMPASDMDPRKRQEIIRRAKEVTR